MDYAAVTFDYESRTADLSTGPVDYFVAGDGAPVLYLHGRGGLRKTVAQQLIAERFRLYMPVHPGFDGRPLHDGVASMPALAALYAEFVDVVIGGRCHVVGHSLGGWLAEWLAVNHPDRVDALVLECPAGLRPGGAPSTTVNAEEVQRLLYCHPEKQPPDDRPAGMDHANRLTAPHYHGGMPLDEALMARLAEIVAPTLLVMGTEERMIPPETKEILCRSVPDLRFAWIEDAAHGIEVDQPEAFAAVVTGFLTDPAGFAVPEV